MCNSCNTLSMILNNLFGNGCGCNNSTPASNNNCGCGNGFDNYYAQQYALGPYAQNNGCGCGNNF